MTFELKKQTLEKKMNKSEKLEFYLPVSSEFLRDFSDDLEQLVSHVNKVAKEWDQPMIDFDELYSELGRVSCFAKALMEMLDDEEIDDEEFEQLEEVKSE